MYCLCRHVGGHVACSWLRRFSRRCTESMLRFFIFDEVLIKYLSWACSPASSWRASRVRSGRLVCGRVLLASSRRITFL
jgi:hypothetical protein